MRFGRKLALVGAGVLVAAGAAWLVLRRAPSDCELIHSLIDQVEEGVETKNARKIMSAISSDYSDSLGLSRRQILQVVLDFVRSEGRYDVLIDTVSIEIHPSRVRPPLAKASMHVLVTKLSPGGAPGEQETIYDGPLEVQLRKEGRKWRVIRSGGWHSVVPEEYF